MDTDPMKYLRMLPKRRRDSNKGTYGKLLVVAGTEGMCGAAFLASLAAYRTGAGLVRTMTHKENRVILQSLLPEAIFTGYDDATELSALCYRQVGWADLLVVGPGLGTGALSVRCLKTMLAAIEALCEETAWIRKFPCLLLDADGLNILSTHPEEMKRLEKIGTHIPVIMTPHPMEMARLLGSSVDEILQDPAQAAAVWSQAHGTITIMKGAETTIRDAEGHAFRNREASPALSKGGSGDVLSGAVAGLYAVLRAEWKENAEKASPDAQRRCWRKGAFDSAVLAVLLHAEAGRQAACVHGTHGVLARETADALGSVMEQYLNSCS
ncbi:MAG TPA: NAD(P)H-hydrate dehydratase [Oribacterium sp.]|nr:NAD(P)H-hydrate dehydratase [Oribacterium sp.]HCS68046.1 NAD(P)H-hydrate dehydratase [Oribacterium sp.]